MNSPHTISAYECIFEEGTLIEERLLSISRLNSEGKVLHRERYDKEGNLIKKDDYQYQGELVSLSREEDLIEKSITKTVCEYLDDKLINQKEYFNDHLSIQMVYIYDDQGQLIQNDILNNDGSLSSRYIFEYQNLPSSSKKTIESFFDEELTLVRLTEIVKDDNGQITDKSITEVYEDRQEVNSQKIEYKFVEGESIKNYYYNGVEAYEVVECFDEEDRVNQTITFDVAKNEESVTSIEYDKRGNVTKEEITIDDVGISVINVVFDEYDNRVELIKKSKLAADFYETRNYKFFNEYDVEK